MIRIAIDGPGGAGKSSVAKAVAKELGIIYVDTGALYRTIGLYMLNSGIDPSDADGVTNALGSFTLELTFIDGRQVVLLNGVDVGDTIRTPAVSMAASAVSAIGSVREYLLNTQREIARKNSVIMDGRDIGTVILPKAEVKIFLTASPEARAKRRHSELVAKGVDITYEQVLSEMNERDKNDSTRELAPCVKADDAILLDNSNFTAEQTVKKVLKIVKKTQKKLKWNFYAKAKIVVAPIYRFFMRVKAVGTKNVPAEGGIVLCANHISAADVVTIGAVCPRQLACVAKKEIFNVPILGRICRALGAIKVDRGANDIGAIKASVSAAMDGRVLTIFPQGHRYPGVNPATTPTHNGAALIAYHAKCDVVPVAINVKNGKYGFLKRLEVVFGKPIKYSELGFTSGGREEYAAATKIIFDEVVKLGNGNTLPAYDPTTDVRKKKKKREN